MFSSLKKSQSAAPLPLESKSTMGAPRLQDESNDGRLRGLATSVIGPELTIAGNLITKGQVQIDGEIEGDVHGIYVLLAEGGLPHRSNLGRGNYRARTCDGLHPRKAGDVEVLMPRRRRCLSRLTYDRGWRSL